MNIDINKREEKKYTIVHVAGRIDATTSDELEDALMDLIGDGQNRIILDLENIDYISSAGLRVLVVITKQVYDSGHFFCTISDNVREIVEMAGFNTFMNIYESLADAEAAMANV